MGSQTFAPKAQTFPKKAPNSPRSLRVECRESYEFLSKLLKGGHIGDYIGDDILGVLKGDTRSLDNGSY